MEEHAASSQPQLPLSRQGSSLIDGLVFRRLGARREAAASSYGYFRSARPARQICHLSDGPRSIWLFPAVSS